MREELADLVYPVIAHGLQLRARLGRDERPDLGLEQNKLGALLKTAAEAQRWPDYAGDGERFLGVRYLLTCWLDELFCIDSPWEAAWNERKLETKLYGTNNRAWNFWVQARLAEAVGADALEVAYLCVMLGFRGGGEEKPADLLTWREETEARLQRGQAQTWPGPQELQPQTDSTPRRGRERLRGVVMAVIGVLALLVPCLTFYLVYRRL
jgi:type IV/VI secretion system ImpK/VasF family protein